MPCRIKWILNPIYNSYIYGFALFFAHKAIMYAFISYSIMLVNKRAVVLLS